MKKILLIFTILLISFRQLGHNISNQIPNKKQVRGIDISAHQKHINWSKVKDIDFVFVKATEGISIIDKKFNHNWSKVKEKKILRGAYHFYRPYVTPEKQFHNFKTMVRLESGDLPPVLDVEVSLKNSKKFINDLKKWLTLAEKHYQIRPIIYCNSVYYRKYFSDKYFDKYPFWIANYVTEDINKIHSSWHFWQFTPRGRVSGINTHVDINIFNGDYNSLLSLCK